MKTTFTVPVGPIHPALKEPVAVKCEIDGEEVVNAEVILGQNHRGVEWIGMHRNNPVQSIHLSERICGICACTHSFALVRAVEEAADIVPSERAEYIRPIVAELDRIHSHILWAGVAAHELGFDTLLHISWNLREKVMDMQEFVTGNRVTFAMYMYGGVRRDIDSERAKKLLEMVRYYEGLINKFVEMFLHDKTIKMRTVGVGILSKEEAYRLCTVGPTVRARGIKKDVRQEEPYAAYADFGVKAITPDMLTGKVVGDVYDNIVVRLLEVKQSLDIIKFCLENMPSGPITTEPNLNKLLVKLKKAEGRGLGRHEAPRGEVFHYVELKGQETFYSWKVRAPSNANVVTWPYMLKGEQIADIPIVVASIDPCISCTNRIVTVDVNSGKEKVYTPEELHRLSVLKTRRLMR